MHKGCRLHFYSFTRSYWTYNCKRLERGSQALCTTITCSSSSHRIPERFFMPRQDEAYPVNSWSHPLTPFPGHDSFLDIQPEKSPGMSLQVESVGIRLLQPPVIKFLRYSPPKRHRGNAGLNHHISLSNTSLVGWAGLLPGFAMDLPSQTNVSMLTASSPRAQPIPTDISPSRHQALSNSFVSPWRKTTTACAHLRVLQGIEDVPRSLERGITIPVLLTG